LQIDGCPLVAGNSSNPYYGCLDSDGDNYRDIYTFDINPNTGLRENQSGDAFPFNPEQWTDTDGDGFGDFQSGNNADVCPQVVGVSNGTFGMVLGIIVQKMHLTPTISPIILLLHKIRMKMDILTRLLNTTMVQMPKDCK
jgi:hypothetical protein